MLPDKSDYIYYIVQYLMVACLAILFLIIVLSIWDSMAAKNLHPERWYQEQHCEGVTEVRLPDRTRVDCLLEEYAIEYDFGSKWAEAIGQSLHYGRMTQRKAGIVLIMESNKDEKYYRRLMDNIAFYNLPITVWKYGNESTELGDSNE